jgi:uncharacterized membrane protein
LLLAFQAGAWPQALAFPPATPKWDALRTLHAALSIIGFIMLAGCAGIFLRWLHLNVPLAARRQATLERRSIHAYVPPAFQYAISGVVVLHLGLWVVAGVTGRYATPAFWGLLVFQFAIAAMFLSFALFAVRRRPGQMDRIFGPGYRRTEVRVAFAAQLLPLMNGLTRLYEQVAGTPVDHVDRVLHLALVLAVLGVAILVGSWSRQTGRSSKASWMPPAKSAGALFVAFMALAALPA